MKREPAKNAVLRWPPQRLLASLSLLRKTQLLLALMLLMVFVVLYGALQYLVAVSFTSIEREVAMHTVRDLAKELAGQQEQVRRVSTDYAVWDDTYLFLHGEQPTYIARNMVDSTFDSNHLDLIIIADSRGTPQYVRVRGPDGDLPAEAQTTIARTLIVSTVASEALEQGDAVASIVMLPAWPVLISAHPVLQSDYAGPAAGVLIMGRRLDTDLIAQIDDRLAATVRFYPLGGNADAPQAQIAEQLLQSGEEALLQPESDAVMRASLLLRNTAGQPVLVAEIVQPRPIWQAGRQMALWTLLILVAVGGISAIIFTLLLNRMILVRLGQLIEGVRQIGTPGRAMHRIPISGDDELSQLAATINGTLQAIESAEQERTQVYESQIQMWDDLHKARQQFLASVSHELRTPITPIVGYTDMLLAGLAGPISDDQQAILTNIITATRRLRALIDDLLDMGRLEAHALHLNLSTVLVQDAVQRSIAMLAPVMEQQGVPVVVEIAPDLPEVWADPQRLEQILTNLISNAIKYNRPDGVVWVRARNPDGLMVAIEVEDTGIGISSAQIGQLFAPFYRADHVEATAVSGIGLGLYIVRSLIELHGGRITVQSEVGRGSTFTVWLPQVPLGRETP